MSLPEIPSEFSELWMRLCRARARGMTGQAYLLAGDNMGVLEQFALAWSRAACCRTPRPDGTPCGSCECCRLWEQNAYPENYVVRPQSKSRTITVDDMRQFEHALSLSPRDGFLKVGMLVEADRLNEASQNAFLKTLEEPPPNTMLLLLTGNMKMLLPTTRSRCQILSLLQNRRDYSLAKEKHLFSLLALLQERSGTANALKAATGIHEIFSNLHDRAEETVSEEDAANPSVQTEDEPLRKQQAEERIARVEAEYVRLRQEMLGAMHAWFLQNLILAQGGSESAIPLPELREGNSLPVSSPEAAVRHLRLMEEFSRNLRLNLDEQLCLEDLCLQITKKS